MILSVYTLPNSIEKIKKTDFNVKKYSKFKYGDRESIEQFASILCEKYFPLIQNHRDKGKIFIASTPLVHAPSASHWLAISLSEQINIKLAKLSFPTSNYINILRSPGLYESADYSKLNALERSKVQSTQSKLLMQPLLKKEDLLIIINDIYVTGAQYREYLKSLSAVKNKKNVIWIYLCKIETSKGSEPKTIIEYFLNDNMFKDHDSVIKFLKKSRENSILPTKRLLLKLLNFDKVLLKSILLNINHNLKRQLYIYGISENIHMDKKLGLKLRYFNH